MAELLTADEFLAQCLGFEHAAFRLETHERYVDDEEQEPLRRFLAGEPPDDVWFMDWCDSVAASSVLLGYPSNCAFCTPLMNVCHSAVVKINARPFGSLESRMATSPGRLVATSTQLAWPLLRLLFCQTTWDRSTAFTLLALLRLGGSWIELFPCPFTGLIKGLSRYLGARGMVRW